jgi:hypothetical protein
MQILVERTVSVTRLSDGEVQVEGSVNVLHGAVLVKYVRNPDICWNVFGSWVESTVCIHTKATRQDKN